MPSVLVWTLADFGAASIFDLIGGTFTIDAGAMPDAAEFSDDDPDFDDFFGNNGQTQDPGLNQLLTQDLVLDGVTVGVVGDGIYNAAEGVLTNNTTGEVGRIIYITINGGSVNEFVGVATTIPINPGDSVTTSDLSAQATEAYEDVIACFTTGCRIATSQGEVAVENLKVGDSVWTRDNGYQTIRWIGSRRLSASHIAAHPERAPVVIKAGALGIGVPERDIAVSRNHRVLFAGSEVEMCFGVNEVLVPAAGLLDLRGVHVRQTPKEVVYWHILFDRHEIIRSDGMQTESYFPGAFAGLGQVDETQAEVIDLFPHLVARGSVGMKTARQVLRVSEGRMLISQLRGARPGQNQPMQFRAHA